MSHRIRSLAALGAVLAATLFASPSWAGPNDKQPADVRLTLGEARYYAHTGAGYLTGALNHPGKSHVGTCKAQNKGRLWMCPATMTGADTRCSAMVWVWGSADGSRYYELHGLRCGKP